MAKHPHTEKIEAYLTGQLRPDEALLFEQEMTRDKELATEVSMRRLEHDAMELMLEKDLKARMAKWKDNPPPNPFDVPPPPLENGFNWKKWLPFLGLAILVFSGLFYFTRPNTPQTTAPATPTEQPGLPSTTDKPDVPIATDEEKAQPEQPTTPIQQPKQERPAPQRESAYIALANDYYDVTGFSSGLKGGGSEKSVIDQAAEAFDAKQFAKTIELLEKPEAGNQSQVRYLRGHAYFNLGRFKDATVEFEAVATRFASDKQSAQWYLLLTYLAQLPAESAHFLELAKEIDASNKHPYWKQTARLMEQFNKLQ